MAVWGGRGKFKAICKGTSGGGGKKKKEEDLKGFLPQIEDGR